MTSNYRLLQKSSPLDEASAEYDSLISTGLDYTSTPLRDHRRFLSLHVVALIFSVLLNLLLAYQVFDARSKHAETDVPFWPGYENLYSPARDAIKYEQRVFSTFGEKTKYHGPPTNETDIHWEDLYQIGLSRITKDEAEQLPNRTEPIPGDESHYIVSLDVFHQLHCLNMIRKALWPARYAPEDIGKAHIPEDPDEFDHNDHCINSIRESIMCHGDEWYPSPQ